MKFNVNKVILLGNITRIDEMRKTKSGTSLLKFGIATNRSWYNKKENDYEQETTFHNLVAWGKTAEHIDKHETKGNKIRIEGRISVNEYTNTNGVKKKSIDIIVEDYTKISDFSNNSGLNNKDTDEITDKIPF